MREREKEKKGRKEEEQEEGKSGGALIGYKSFIIWRKESRMEVNPP